MWLKPRQSCCASVKNEDRCFIWLGSKGLRGVLGRNHEPQFLFLEGSVCEKAGFWGFSSTQATGTPHGQY